MATSVGVDKRRTPAQDRGRFPGVEGLRGLAAAAVLLSHVYLYASPDGARYELGRVGVVPRASGTAGVVLFFTLSAFLLYRPFVAALLNGSRQPSVRGYLRNRMLRILPGYWLAVLGAGLVLQTTYLPPLQVQGRSLASEPEVLAANLLLVQSYAPSTLLTGIGPAWSLVVEMAFYLVLPLLAGLAVLLAARTAAGRRRPWVAAVVPAFVLLAVGQAGAQLAAALPAGEGGPWAGSWHAVVARSFLAHAGLFTGGLLLAVLHTQVSRGAVRLPRRWRGAAAAAAVGVGVPAFLALGEYRLAEHPGTLLLSVSGVLLLALVVLPHESRSWLVRVLACRPLQWTGLVSYGVFLWNEPLVWFLRAHGATAVGRRGFAASLLLTLAAAGAVALLSWWLVERPSLAWKKSVPAPRAEAGLGSAHAPS